MHSCRSRRRPPSQIQVPRISSQASTAGITWSTTSSARHFSALCAWSCLPSASRSRPSIRHSASPEKDCRPTDAGRTSKNVDLRAEKGPPEGRSPPNRTLANFSRESWGIKFQLMSQRHASALVSVMFGLLLSFLLHLQGTAMKHLNRLLVNLATLMGVVLLLLAEALNSTSAWKRRRQPWRKRESVKAIKQKSIRPWHSPSVALQRLQLRICRRVAMGCLDQAWRCSEGAAGNCRQLWVRSGCRAQHASAPEDAAEDLQDLPRACLAVQELVVTHESEGVQFMRAFPEPSEELQPIDNCCVQKSVLVKPPLCNLKSEGFGDTPCQ